MLKTIANKKISKSCVSNSVFENCVTKCQQSLQVIRKYSKRRGGNRVLPPHRKMKLIQCLLCVSRSLEESII